jgi:type II secretory pathway component GspD/PulD (secretin)
LLFWLAGSSLLVGLLVLRSRQAAQLAHHACAAKAESQSLLDDCARLLGLRRGVLLKLVASACSPAVCGLGRPVVLLPQRLADGLPADQLRAVLLHELIHVRRHDVWVNCLQALLQVVYWWHPLVWLANARIRRVREEAVDEAVMVALGSQAEAYPATLLEVAKLAFARPLTALGLVGIFESRGALHLRIRRLLDRPTPRSAKLNFASLVAVAVCGALLLPMACGQRTGNPKPLTPPGALSSTAAIVLVECRFLDLDAAAIGFLNTDPPALVGTNGHRTWVVPPGQVPSRLDEFAKLPGVRVAAAPRLTLIDGMMGQISDTHADSLNGRGAILRYACEVTPRVNGTNIDLTLKATMAELVEANGNGTPVPSASASGDVSHDLANVRVTVPNSGGVIVQNPSLPVTQGGHLVLAVKSTVQPGARGAGARAEDPPPVAVATTIKTETPLPETKLQEQRANTLVQDGKLLYGIGQYDEAEAKPSSATTNDPSDPASPKPSDQAQRETRVFKVDTWTFAKALTNSPSWAGRSFSDALRGFIEAAGVSVSPPNQVYYTQGTGVLRVRASPEELDRIARALDALIKAPQQITIDAKFIEAPEEFVKQIENLTRGTEITAVGVTNEMRILSDPQARTLVHALEKTPEADVLSTPKVTTLSGRQTQIQQVEIKTVLTGIDPGAVATPGRTAADVTNASPFLSAPVPVGPTLDLIPTVAEDGYTVQLTTIASLVEFLGYDKPTNTVPVYVEGRKRNVEEPRPRLRTRQATGGASVYDGQSLLLIGPAATVTNRFAGKVPVVGDIPLVGRLFRREGTFTVSKRLLILITPTLIDPAGNVIHTPGDLPFDPDSVPPQPNETTPR